MLAIILMIIGFLVASGSLGNEIITSLDWGLVAYWISFAVLGIITIISSVIFTGAGTMIGYKATERTSGLTKLLATIGGTIGGGLLSIFLSALVLLKPVVCLVIAYWLRDSIDPSLTEWGMLESKEVVGIIGLVILSLIPMGSNSSSIKKTNQ